MHTPGRDEAGGTGRAREAWSVPHGTTRDPTRWGREGPQVTRPVVGVDSWGRARTLGHRELLESLDAWAAFSRVSSLAGGPCWENGRSRCQAEPSVLPAGTRDPGPQRAWTPSPRAQPRETAPDTTCSRAGGAAPAGRTRCRLSVGRGHPLPPRDAGCTAPPEASRVSV